MNEFTKKEMQIMSKPVYRKKTGKQEEALQGSARNQRRIAQKLPIQKPHPDQWLEDELKGYWNKLVAYFRK
jgi:hypothetical protein